MANRVVLSNTGVSQQERQTRQFPGALSRNEAPEMADYIGPKPKCARNTLLYRVFFTLGKKNSCYLRRYSWFIEYSVCLEVGGRPGVLCLETPELLEPSLVQQQTSQVTFSIYETAVDRKKWWWKRGRHLYVRSLTSGEHCPSAAAVFGAQWCQTPPSPLRSSVSSFWDAVLEADLLLNRVLWCKTEQPLWDTRCLFEETLPVHRVEQIFHFSHRDHYQSVIF